LSSQSFGAIEWKSSIKEELGPMDDTKVWLYDEITLLQQLVSPLLGIQKKAQEVVKLLKVANKAINHLQEWVSKYLDAPQCLEKKDKIFADIDRDQLRLHHQNYMRLGE